MHNGVSAKDKREGMRSNAASFSRNTRTGRMRLKAFCDNAEVCTVSPRATSKQTTTTTTTTKQNKNRLQLISQWQR